MEETNSIATNEEPEQLKCVHCPSAKFLNVENLKNHSRNRHRESKFFCDCGNAFTNQNSKEQHVNEHHSKKERHKKAPKNPKTHEKGK